MTLAKVLKSGTGTFPVHHAKNAHGTWFRRVPVDGKWAGWMVSAPAPATATVTTLLTRLPAGDHTTALLALAA